MPDRRRAWAEALFEAAPDAERRAAYGDALDALASAMAGAAGRSLRDYLRDPSIRKGEKVETLALAASPKAGEGPRPGSSPDPLFRRFCALLVEKGRAGLLPAVAASYRLVRDRAEGVSPLEIEAAREVPDAAVRRISEAWGKASGASSVRTKVRVKPELVAGYRLRSGSILLDYSVAGRVERLGRKLAEPLGSLSGPASREEG